MKYVSSFKSEADGLEISIMAVLPDQKPYRAVIQLVHGMSEHKERYLPFMKFLVKQGYVTVIHDHRGHGKSVKYQQDLGYTYGGGANAMLQDIGTVNRKIHVHFPDLPVILMGHSNQLAFTYRPDNDGSFLYFVCCNDFCCRASNFTYIVAEICCCSIYTLMV